MHQFIAVYDNDKFKTKLKGMSPVIYRRHTFKII
ncbi:IS3 family transposase [Lacicoccus qingdaonensis]